MEYTAYIPLMRACAERNVLCFLVEMLFNLAVFDINAADGIKEQYPDIENWYIGGHSLGGSMAASYLESHREDFDGLVLSGSYSTADLSKKRPEGAFGIRKRGYGYDQRKIRCEYDKPS